MGGLGLWLRQCTIIIVIISFVPLAKISLCCKAELLYFNRSPEDY